MPNPVNPNPPNLSNYPQWGVKINTNGTSGSIKEVANDAAKLAAMNAGYLDWFPSKTLAQSGLSSQTSAFGSGGESTLQAIKSANPLGALFQANIWMRVGQVVLGLALIVVGLAKLAEGTPAGKAAAKVAKVAALA
jgi:hypothetical protein